MNIPLMILMVDVNVPPFHDDDLKRSKCIPRSKRRSEVLLVEGSFASSQLMVVVVVLVGLGWIPLVGWMRDLRRARDLAG